MTADARQVERLRESAERRLHADRPPYTRLVPVGAHVLIELLDAVEAHAALVKAVEDEAELLRTESTTARIAGDFDVAEQLWAGSNRLRAILAASDTAADRGAR